MNERTPPWSETLATAARLRVEPRKQWRALGLASDDGLGTWFKQRATDSPNVRLTFASLARPSVVTLTEIVQRAERVARGLHALGYRRGDVVVVQVPHWQEALELFIAATGLGVVFVPVVHILGSTELGFILRQTRARALVTPVAWRNIDYVARYRSLGDLPDLEHVIVIGDGAFPGPAIPWNEMLARGDKASAPETAARGDDVCMLLYTSGTTADPKGALLTHANFAAEAATLRRHWHATPGRAAIALFPAGHMGGVLWQIWAFLAGVDTVLMDQFDAAQAVELIGRHDVGFTSGTPLHLNAMLDAAGSRGLPSVSHMVLGGATVPPSAIERGADLNIRIVRSYGSTEQTTIANGRYDDPLVKRANTDGRLMDGVTVRLVDEEDRPVPVGEPGEILTMGPELFQGYLDPAVNAGAFAADGYFRTGDIGVLDGDGFLTIVDRKKDIVIRGGENISSREVEDMLHRMPQIAEAAVIGWPDARMGERVGAFLKLRDGATVDLDAIRRHFAGLGVARQKTPEVIRTIADFPRTPVGKVRKADLRALARREG